MLNMNVCIGSFFFTMGLVDVTLVFLVQPRDFTMHLLQNYRRYLSVGANGIVGSFRHLRLYKYKLFALGMIERSLFPCDARSLANEEVRVRILMYSERPM